jgi:hypothetical protein
MAARKGQAVGRVLAKHAGQDKDGYQAAARTYVEQCLNQVNLKNCRASGGSPDGDYGYFELVAAGVAQQRDAVSAYVCMH